MMEEATLTHLQAGQLAVVETKPSCREFTPTPDVVPWTNTQYRIRCGYSEEYWTLNPKGREALVEYHKLWVVVPRNPLENVEIDA